jgi:hypothetical protein
MEVVYLYIQTRRKNKDLRAAVGRENIGFATEITENTEVKYI